MVLERRGYVVYIIKFDNSSERMYHINMLKPYVSRDGIQDAETLKPVESAGEKPIDAAGISATIMGSVEESDVGDENERMKG